MNFDEKFTLSPEERLNKLRIIDGTLFRQITSRKDVCQEILKTLLNNGSLEVISVQTQYTIDNTNRVMLYNTLCSLSDGSLCNIALQQGNINDDTRQIRYNSALILEHIEEIGIETKDIPNVIILYISEYDVLGDRQAVQPLVRCRKVGNQYIPIDEKMKVYFATTDAQDDSKQAKLLRLFLENSCFYDADFPCLSEAVHHYKGTKGGQAEMCDIVEQVREEGRQEGMKEGRQKGRQEGRQEADEYAIKVLVETLIGVHQTLDATIDIVTKKYPDASPAHITELYNESKIHP